MDDPGRIVSSETDEDRRGRTPLRDTRWRARKPVPKRTPIKETMSESREGLFVPDWYQHLSIGCGILADDESIPNGQLEWWPDDWAPLMPTSHADLSKQIEHASPEPTLESRDKARNSEDDGAQTSGSNQSQNIDSSDNPKPSERAHLRYLGRRRQLSSGSVLGPKVDRVLSGISLPWTVQRSSTQP